MAKQRLNDTRALTDAPGDGASHSISTRKIDNGYLIDSSYCNSDTGEYRHSTSFSTTPPRLIPGRAARAGSSPDAGNSLADTMKYLKG